jgi:16S rRNA (cytosine967-C5)-methyltransferase
MSGAEPSTIGSPRASQAAIELFSLWQEKPEADHTPLDRIVSTFFRAHHELNSGERRWISSAVYGSVRLMRRQAHLLSTLDQEQSPVSIIALWQNESSHSAGPELAAAISSLPASESPSDFLRTTLSFADDMADSLEQILGAEAIEAGAAFNLQAPITIRVNSLRCRPDRVLKALPGAVQTQYSPWGIELPRRVNIFDQPGYREGWYEIQEEASQLAALLANVRPGMTVVDVGAGAGGKTLALAAMMECTGSLVALDYSEKRLDELTERAKRAKAPGIEICRVHLSPDGMWNPKGNARREITRLKSRADCVFMDAPCTGSGAIRRSPDAKWRTYSAADMSRDQLNLLCQSAALVAQGGCLVYVTCSFERAQNEEIIDRFLSTRIGEQFTIEPAYEHLTAARERAAVQCMGPRHSGWKPAPMDDLFDGPYLRTWPHKHGLDAFFGARLKRRE